MLFQWRIYSKIGLIQQGEGPDKRTEDAPYGAARVPQYPARRLKSHLRIKTEDFPETLQREGGN